MFYLQNNYVAFLTTFARIIFIILVFTRGGEQNAVNAHRLPLSHILAWISCLVKLFLGGHIKEGNKKERGFRPPLLF